MKEWKTYKLGDICSSISETYKSKSKSVVLINTSDVLEGRCLNHEFVPNKDLKGQFKKVFKFGDILYSEIRPANKRFAYIDFDATDYIASTKLMVLRNNDKVTNRFLYHYLKSESTIAELQALAESRSGTFPQITFSELSQLEISIPDIETQLAISSFIDTLESKIELNRQINDNLEQQAQNIFNHYFIESQTELGPYSEGFLTDIAVYLNGLAMQKFRPEGSDSGLPVLKIKELGQRSCDNNSDRCSSVIKDEYIVNDGDVIFSWSGTLLVDLWCGGKCGLNQHLFKVTSDSYPTWFYYFWTKHHLDNFIRVAKDKAVTMGHIKRTELEKANVIIPSKEKLSEIDKILSPIIDGIITHRVEMRRLVQLRDSLLPELMSGELKINEIDC